jgi:hypothetical protein
VREVGEPAGLGPLADQRLHHVEHLLHPVVARIGGDRRQVHAPRQAHLRAEQLAEAVLDLVAVEAGHGAHTDSRNRPVGHGVDVHAARDGPDAQRG